MRLLFIIVNEKANSHAAAPSLKWEMDHLPGRRRIRA